MDEIRSSEGLGSCSDKGGNRVLVPTCCCKSSNHWQVPVNVWLKSLCSQMSRCLFSSLSHFAFETFFFLKKKKTHTPICFKELWDLPCFWAWVIAVLTGEIRPAVCLRTVFFLLKATVVQKTVSVLACSSVSVHIHPQPTSPSSPSSLPLLFRQLPSFWTSSSSPLTTCLGLVSNPCV